MPYLFTTPTVDEGPIGAHRLWWFYKLARGVTVIKTSDGYYETRDPSQEELDEAEVYYLGGHDYVVDDAEAADLTAAGYAQFLTVL